MTDLDVDAIDEALTAMLGDGLRVLATGDLEAATYDVHHVREDLLDHYDQGVADEVFDDVLSERYFELGGPYPDVVGAKLHTIRVFEACVSFATWVPEGDRAPMEAVFVEFDRSAQDRLPAILDAIEEAVPGS